jgi:PPM family protein phosphatase
LTAHLRVIAYVANRIKGRFFPSERRTTAVVAAVSELANDPARFRNDRAGWLRALDHRMSQVPAIGETTAVVVELTALGPIGVAVGDSEVWWIGDDEYGSLTEAAHPKPWLGSGAATPVRFTKPRQYFKWLLLATDGLFKYAAPKAICDVVRTAPLDETPAKLIELVRYPSGQLPDDIAVFVARWEHEDEPRG